MLAAFDRWGDAGTDRLSDVTLQEGPGCKPENTLVLLETCFPDQQQQPLPLGAAYGCTFLVSSQTH